MKIALCGAHGVGKTTISKILSEELAFPILPDIVPDAFRLGFEINENTPPETQVWLIGKQLENERREKAFVADKCIFDYFVYAEALGMDADLVRLAERIAAKNGKYDFLFFIRPEFPIEDDGLRSTNIEFQKAVADTYERFLTKNEIPFTMLTGSVEERKKKALEVIRG
jgi:thymidylate kinase